MTSKIRIRLGDLEVEYEGPEGFLTTELPGLLAALSQLPHKDVHPRTSQKTAGSMSGTTSSIASKLKCKSGPELVLAAAARLTIVGDTESFTRQVLHTEMKSASAYYKKTYGSNLTKYVNGLVRAGKLVESAKDKFSLSATERADLEVKIAR